MPADDINQIGPAAYSYTPSPDTTAQIDRDVATYLITWSNQSTALLAEASKYKAAYQSYNNAMVALVNIKDTGTPEEIAAAKATLDAAQTVFTTEQTKYEALYDNLNQTATLLVNAQAEKQKQLDDNLNSNLATALPNLSSNPLYSDILAANQRRLDGRSALNLAINNYRDNEANIRTARKELLDLNAKLLDDCYTIISTETKDNWVVPADMTQDQADITAKQNEISGYISDRTVDSTAINTALVAYKKAFDAPMTDTEPGLTTLLQQAYAGTSTDFRALMASLQDNYTFAIEWTESFYKAQVAADAVGTMSTPAQIEAEITQLKEETTTAIQRMLSTGMGGVEINVPQLPAPEGDVSMNDIMRFITKAQLYMDDLRRKFQLTDAQLNALRLTIWVYMLSILAAEFSKRLAYLSSLSSADSYNQVVKDKNDARYTTAQDQQTFIHDNKDKINGVITDTQGTVADFQDAQNIVNALNLSAQESVKLYNAAAETEPETTNRLDIFDDDTPDLTLPTPQDIPSAIPELTLIDELPDPPAPSYPLSDADKQKIDEYNQTIEKINETLYPIRDKLAALDPPITFNLLQPLSYAETIGPGEFIDLTGSLNILMSSYTTLVSLISQSFSTTLTSQDEQDLLKELTVGLRLRLTAPVATKTRGTDAIGAGLGISTLEVGVSPGTVNRVMNELMESDMYKTAMLNLLEQGTFFGALPAGLRLPEGYTTYSTLGMVRGEEARQGEVGVRTRSEISTENTQYASVADALIVASENTKLLRENAVFILSQSDEAKKLTDAELQLLTDKLVVMQRLQLLTMATVAAASIGAQSGSSEANARVDMMLGAPNYNAALPKTWQESGLGTILDATLAPEGYLAALGGAQNAAAIIAQLKSKGMAFTGTPGSPEYIASILNEAGRVIEPAQQAAFKEEVSTALARLGLSPSLINTVITSKGPIGNAVIEALNAAPGSFAASLGVNVAAIEEGNPALYASLEGITAKYLSAITILSPAEKMQITLGIGAGIISPEQASKLSLVLAQIQKEGATPALVASLNELKPQEISKSLADRVKTSVDKLAKNEDDKKYVERLVGDFSKSIVNQKDFYQVSINFLLAPGKTFLKNFSIITAQGGKPQTPTQILT